MSRKHFIAIAETIRFMNVDAQTRQLIAEEMARTLKGFNSAFDRDRFITAATLPTRASQPSTVEG